MIKGTLHSIPSPNQPNPERLRDFLEYIADVLMKLEQKEQMARELTKRAHWIQAPTGN